VSVIVTAGEISPKIVYAPVIIEISPQKIGHVIVNGSVGKPEIK